MSKYSDLPFRVASDRLLIVQPQATVGLVGEAGREELRVELKREGKPRVELMEKAFKDALGLKGLIHVTSLTCSNYHPDPGEPIGLGPQCGSLLKIQPVPDGKKYAWLRDKNSQVLITCSNPSCGMSLGSWLTLAELENLLLHMMLKQMVPDLATCNFVDCTQAECIRLHGGEREAIKRIGLVSVASEVFWGVVVNGYFTSATCQAIDNFGLGFTLVPGMNTRNGCDGFDEWFRFLVQKKFEALKELQRQLVPALLGPKPRTRD